MHHRFRNVHQNLVPSLISHAKLEKQPRATVYKTKHNNSKGRCVSKEFPKLNKIMLIKKGIQQNHNENASKTRNFLRWAFRGS